MSSTNSSSTLSPAGSGVLSSSDSVGGFAYGVGVSIGMLLLITTISLASYFCARTNASAAAQEAPADGPEAATVDMEAGLDEATLKSYPKVVYSQAKLQKKGSMATSCSICLGDYKDSDVLKILPECGHQFHVKCVDLWLQRQPTCPLCRMASPSPSPLPTPLAEVVPLSRQS